MSPVNHFYSEMRQAVMQLGCVCQTCGSSSSNWFYDINTGEPLDWNFKDWGAVTYETHELTCFSCIAGDINRHDTPETAIQKKCRTKLAKRKMGKQCKKCVASCNLTEQTNCFHYVCEDPSSFVVFTSDSVQEGTVENIVKLVQNSNLYCSNCLYKKLLKTYGKRSYSKIYRRVYELIWSETNNGTM